MPRSVSATFLTAVHGAETGEAFLALITIDHASLAQPIRVTSDAVDTVSRGDTYVRYPFQVELPSDVEDRPPTARLTIDNVHRDILLTLRALPSAPTIAIEIVLGSDPDTVEAAFPDFTLRDIGFDALTIEGELTVEHYDTEPFPAGVFSPADFPGLF